MPPSRLGRVGDACNYRSRCPPQGPRRRAGLNLPLAAHRIDDLALATRLYILRRMTSCRISRSRDRSATSFCSLAFTSSSCASRLISSGASFAVPLRYEVGRWVDTGPAADARHRHPICALLQDERLLGAPENVDAFIVFRSSRPRARKAPTPNDPVSWTSHHRPNATRLQS